MNQINLLALMIVERKFRMLIPWLFRRLDSSADMSNSGGRAGSSDGGDTNININSANSGASNRGLAAGGREHADEEFEEDLD